VQQLSLFVPQSLTPGPAKAQLGGDACAAETATTNGVPLVAGIPASLPLEGKTEPDASPVLVPAPETTMPDPVSAVAIPEAPLAVPD
jgi:hypothetical protein